MRPGPQKNLLKADTRLAEIIRFGIVGTLATLLQYGFYLLAADVVGLSAVISTPVSYILSFIINFILTSYFTFRSQPSAKRGVGFTLSHLVNMGLQTLFVAIFNPLVGKTWALLPSMLICIPINFLLVRFVFKSKFFSDSPKQDAENIPITQNHNKQQ